MSKLASDDRRRPLSGEQHDAALVAALDVAFQDAVKSNDAQAIDELLHERFVMVLGDGRTLDREDILNEARSGEFSYEIQDEDPGTQSVRIWGDTAVVTALLWIKGSRCGTAFERRVWFSDTYVRTDAGWRYAFAQVSLPLPHDGTLP